MGERQRVSVGNPLPLQKLPWPYALLPKALTGTDQTSTQIKESVKTVSSSEGQPPLRIRGSPYLRLPVLKSSGGFGGGWWEGSEGEPLEEGPRRSGGRFCRTRSRSQGGRRKPSASCQTTPLDPKLKATPGETNKASTCTLVKQAGART